MRKLIRESVDSGFARTASAPGSKSPPRSTTSAKRSGTLSGHWPQPKNVKQFASQANKVATMVLEGTIAIETARVYSSIARTVSQSVSIEVARARMLKSVPDLDFEVSEED